jgi:tryptophan synthase beta chain
MRLTARGRTEYAWVDDGQALEAFQWLARTEGIIPALESAHAVAWVRQALPTLPDDSVVLLNISGRGDKDVESVRHLLDGFDAGALKTEAIA